MKTDHKATIRLPQAVALYIGAVLGSGILIVPGLAAQMAGPASLLDWGAMVLLVLPLSACMAFLAQRYPNLGGVSYFVTKAFGPRFGYFAGWFFLMSVPIGAPVAALTGSGYLTASLGLTEPYRIAIACGILLAALVLNFIGMSLAGRVQVAVVAGILVIIFLAIIGAAPNIKVVNFAPFMPHGPGKVAEASTLLFWCFIGWEAVSHLTEEFVHPEKDVMRATMISAVLIGAIYFLVAVCIVGTGSYGRASNAPLVAIASESFGPSGAVIIGTASLLICLATVIAYIGAAARLARSLAENGHAPKWLGRVSRGYQTPAGGLAFLAGCFILVITLYSLKVVSLTTLIQLPNATFLLTYLGGCAAGVCLFKRDRKKLAVSLVSLISTAIMFLFVGWALVYPAVVILFVLIGSHCRNRPLSEYQKDNAAP